MRIYTGMTSGVRLQEIKSRGLGVMISSHPDITFLKSFIKQDLEGIPLALDNGAFSYFNKNQCFSPAPFLEALNILRLNKAELDFITVPDRVACGMDSYRMSQHWAKNMIPGPGLALVIQDGFEDDIDVSLYDYLFLGGTPTYKWNNLKKWAAFAREIGKKLHVGQVGKTEGLNMCRELGITSVDSTSAIRNNAWFNIDEHQNPSQMSLL